MVGITPEHEALLSHLMAKTGCCCAPNDRYCSEGARLSIECTAAWLASLPTLEQRRYWLGICEANKPEWAERIERRMAEIFKEKRSREQK